MVIIIPVQLTIERSNVDRPTVAPTTHDHYQSPNSPMNENIDPGPISEAREGLPRRSFLKVTAGAVCGAAFGLPKIEAAKPPVSQRNVPISYGSRWRTLVRISLARTGTSPCTRLEWTSWPQRGCGSRARFRRRPCVHRAGAPSSRVVWLRRWAVVSTGAVALFQTRSKVSRLTCARPGIIRRTTPSSITISRGCRLS